MASRRTSVRRCAAREVAPATPYCLRAGGLEARVGGAGPAECVLDPLQCHRVVDDPEVLREVERTAVLEEHFGGPWARREARRGVWGDDLVVGGLDLRVGDESRCCVAGVQMAEERGAGHLVGARGGGSAAGGARP